MTRNLVMKATAVLGGLGVAASALAPCIAAAQPQDGGAYNNQGPPPAYGQQPGGPPPGYNGGPAPGYDGGPPPGYDGSQPPPPPPGYDGSRPPPPPPGYAPDRESAEQQAQDRQYADYARRWADSYCVKAHGNAGEGAVIGGLFGAIIGSGLGGRHDRGGGALAGAAVGAASGAVIAGSSGSNATSPGCPPGYVVRDGAPAFYYAGGPYYYAAPAWYNPWVFYGGAWTYRPYPYHTWYYRHYYRR